ncbi:MAG: GFA family protein [Bdellovibrionia bacterium]
MKTYHGSCECEKVKFEATFDLQAGTFKCNCRMCTKARLWGAVVQPENFKVTSGEEFLSKYWKSPVHHFCKECGIKVFAQGVSPIGKPLTVVVLAALDDLDPREWAAAPVRIFDGQHDRFDRAPDFTGHL